MNFYFFNVLGKLFLSQHKHKKFFQKDHNVLERIIHRSERKVYLFFVSNKGAVNNNNNKYNECGRKNVRKIPLITGTTA
jgi:hypothetical protein